MANTTALTAGLTLASLSTTRCTSRQTDSKKVAKSQNPRYEPFRRAAAASRWRESTSVASGASRSLVNPDCDCGTHRRAAMSYSGRSVSMNSFSPCGCSQMSRRRWKRHGSSPAFGSKTASHSVHALGDTALVPSRSSRALAVVHTPSCGCPARMSAATSRIPCRYSSCTSTGASDSS